VAVGSTGILGPAATLRSLAAESAGILSLTQTTSTLSWIILISRSAIITSSVISPIIQTRRRLSQAADQDKAKRSTLKHRPGYQDRRPIDVLASSKQEKALLTALASPGTRGSAGRFPSDVFL